jgi:hypothetical protein
MSRAPFGELAPVSPFSTLSELAMHVDKLLLQPGNMVAVRLLVEEWLAEEHAGDFPFPSDPNG